MAAWFGELKIPVRDTNAEFQPLGATAIASELAYTSIVFALEHFLYPRVFIIFTIVMSSHPERTRFSERIRQRRLTQLQSSSSRQAASGPPQQHRSKKSSKQRAGPQRASPIHTQEFAQRARRARELGVCLHAPVLVFLILILILSVMSLGGYPTTPPSTSKHPVPNTYYRKGKRRQDIHPPKSL